MSDTSGTTTAPNSTYTGTDADAPFTATATFKDAAGNDVAPDDVPVWATSDPTIASVVASADGTSAVFTVAGRAGSCTATCTSVNKAGITLVLQGAIIINAGDAVQGEIDFPTTATTPVVDPSDPTQPSTSATPGDTAPAGADTGDTGADQSATAAAATS